MRRLLAAFSVVALAGLSLAPVHAVVLTGEVRSLGAQALLAPPTVTGGPVVLRMYVPDGTRVEKGDPVLRIDAGQAASKLQNLKDQIEKTRDSNAKNIADAELDVVDAQIALAEAVAAQKKAAVDAAIPADLIPAIDYDRYQGTLKSAAHESELAQEKLADAKAAVLRARQDGKLALQKLEMELGFNQDQVDVATVYAEQPGVVIHAFKNVSFEGRSLGRYEQGASAFPGTRVGEIVGPEDGYKVHAWVLEADRDRVKVGAQVQLGFGALPGVSVRGEITSVSGSASTKKEWGDGRYYGVDIKAQLKSLPLMPGMSVRVDTDADNSLAARAVAQDTTPMQATGEIYARDSVPVTPPTVRGIWQFNITSMPGDGDKVIKGQPVVVFSGGRVARKLPSSQSKLAEKQRALDKLKLDLANKKRDVKLAVSQAHADADKARRKAEQPESYVAAVKYKKLVIDRHRAEQVLELTEHRSKVAARDRKAQLDLAEAEVKILQHEVNRLQRSLGKLTMLAPRDGILLHRSDWSGDKYDVGSSVFRGTTIADIPDLSTLAVKANLPEHDFSRVRVGQPVTITLSGGIARRLSGHIRSIGSSVHSKSRAEPEPVIDLDIALDENDLADLKPGQPVRVRILAAEDKDKGNHQA